MSSKETKLQEVLKARGIEMSQVDEQLEADIPEAKESSKRLMETYYTLKVTADMEVPYWYNRSWWENDGEVIEVRRARAMGAALAHMTPTIQPYEKIVMNKTKNVRGGFPFPRTTSSFFLAQADALMAEVDAPAENEADAVSIVGAGGGNVTKSYGNIISLAKKFGMRKEEIPVLVKASEPWRGISIEDLADKYSRTLPGYGQYRDLMDSVVCMFDSFAIAQGREVSNYYVPLEYGFDRIIEICNERMAEVMGEAGDDGILGMSRGYYYAAMKEIVIGLSKWCENYSKQAAYLASVETDTELKANYEKIKEVMHNIAHKKPSNFWEAIQLTVCCHLGVTNEDAMSGLSIGRLGQVLQPYYEHDIREGIMTDEEVIEILELYRIKITCIECFASAGVSGGVLSGNTFNNLSMGGLNKEGLTAVTPLEYLIIEAGMRNRTPQPTLSVLYDEKTPEDFLMKAAACTKLGLGYPAWMNNQGGINYMLDNYGPEGMNLEDARAWCLGGCLESSPGCFQPLHFDGKVTWVPGGASPTCGTGVHFLAMPKILELVLTNGLDKRTGKRVYPAHNKNLDTFEAVYEQWKQYMNDSILILNKVNNIQMDIWRKYLMPAVNSLLKPDCFKNGQHLGNMGARYNASINVESCGTITLINSLASIKKNVYDEKKFTIEEMTDAMINNFGFKTAYETGVFSPDYRENTENSPKYEEIFAACVNAPKYGNAIPYVDQLLKRYEYDMYDMVHSYHSYYGKPLYLCQISVSTHGPQGFITLGTADSRLAGTTYSDGSLSAAPGTDQNGLYALFESATVYDHGIHQNSQMNLKLHPTAVKGLNGTRKLLDVVRAYMRKGGFHVQFNIVDSKTLRKAQVTPDKYRDLMIRVAGFTQYWCEIGKPIQDEVIFRTQYDEA